MKLQEVFYQMTSKEGISVFEMEMAEGLPNHHCIRLQGEHAIYEGHALFLEEEKLFVFYILGGLIVPENLCEKAAWEFMKMNYGLKMGQWFIDPDSRVITLRTCQYFLQEEGLAERMHTIVADCGKLTDESYLSISKMITGMETE